MENKKGRMTPESTSAKNMLNRFGLLATAALTLAACNFYIDESQTGQAISSQSEPTPHVVPPDYYRQQNPGYWTPVGEHATPTPTKPPGYYTNPDLLTQETSGPTPHVVPPDYYRQQNPGYWTPVGEHTIPPTPVPEGYYSPEANTSEATE